MTIGVIIFIVVLWRLLDNDKPVQKTIHAVQAEPDYGGYPDWVLEYKEIQKRGR